MVRTFWTERKFNFDFPEGWIFNILERLRGTGIRLKEMTDGLPDSETQYKPQGKWSIREQIGHLCDLEELHEGRVEDFLAGKEILRAADISNVKTNEANHNARTIESLLYEFNRKWKSLIARLESLDDKVQYSRALHPRLKVQVRPVDIAFFTAEHDDHHMASIREIINNFKG